VHVVVPAAPRQGCSVAAVAFVVSTEIDSVASCTLQSLSGEASMQRWQRRACQLTTGATLVKLGIKRPSLSFIAGSQPIPSSSTSSLDRFWFWQCWTGCDRWTPETRPCCRAPRWQRWGHAHCGPIDVVSTLMTSPACAEVSRLTNHWTWWLWHGMRDSRFNRVELMSASRKYMFAHHHGLRINGKINDGMLSQVT